MDLQKEIEDLKVKSGYSGKPQQWQYGFDLACRELAKNQAVQDGFVVVNKKELAKVLNCVTDYWLIDTDSVQEFKKIESLVQDEVDAVFGSQEQSHD